LPKLAEKNQKKSFRSPIISITARNSRMLHYFVQLLFV
jgi:hypothetical protein